MIYAQENGTHTINWDFEMQTDHLISEGGEMKESKKIGKILGHCLKTKKAVKHEGDSDTNCSWCTWNSSQRLVKGRRRIENQRKNRDHPEYNIIEINQNIQKSP